MKKAKTRHQVRTDHGGVPKKVVSYSIPESLAERVRAAAAESGMSASAYLTEYLSRDVESIAPILVGASDLEGGANVKRAA